MFGRGSLTSSEFVQLVRESNSRLKESNEQLLAEIRRKDQELEDQRAVWDQQLADVRRLLGNSKFK